MVHRLIVLTLLAVVTLLQGCHTLREIAALRLVNFEIDRVSNARLAGVSIERVRSFDDLSASDVLRIGMAVADRRLPFQFQLHVAALNPADNPVSARLVRMDWTLFLDDRETISGILDETYVLPPGEVRDVPIRIELDLIDFFERNMRDLVDLTLAVAGVGERPMNVALRATPAIDTPVGPIDYPRPITIVRRDVGGAAPATTTP